MVKENILENQNLEINTSLISFQEELNGLTIEKVKELGTELQNENSILKTRIEELKKILEQYENIHISSLDHLQVESSVNKKVTKLAEKETKNKEKLKDTKQKIAVEEAAIDISRLDFRIGKIVDVKKHPDADSLYVETVDIGEDSPRTVVSGLVKHVPEQELNGRLVVLLCNLKPAKMRGVLSEAMVMCASSPEKVEVLIPPEGSVPGDLIEFEGFRRNPDKILNPKKKIFETIAPDLKTNNEKIACYNQIPFTVLGKGCVCASSLIKVSIK